MKALYTISAKHPELIVKVRENEENELIIVLKEYSNLSLLDSQKSQITWKDYYSRTNKTTL